MYDSLEFLIGLLDDSERAYVAEEDFVGAHGEVVRRWQELGFIRREPGINPVPSCPHCGEGTPYRLGERLLCSHCRSRIHPRHLLLWEMRCDVFLSWLADEWRLRGGVRQIDHVLWQLGTWASGTVRCECFFVQRGNLSEVGTSRLTAYRHALLLYGRSAPAALELLRLPSASLLELLEAGEDITVRSLEGMRRTHGRVRFDEDSGGLWAGDLLLGEVPVGSKEFHFLACLARHRDQFVAYEDLKYEVLRRSGRTDSREETTFCHRLKSRIKRRFIPRIDLVLATTNKATGYRLRGEVE